MERRHKKNVRQQLQRLLPMTNKEKKIDDEEDDIVSTAIGKFGKWQCLWTFLLSLVNVPCTWHIVAAAFFKNEENIWCARTEQFKDINPIEWKNYTQPDGWCEIYDLSSIHITNLSQLPSENLTLIPCQHWEYESGDRTWISEFNLVCERETMTSVIEMMFLGGVAIGGLICGIFADKYGRKRTLLVCLLLQSVLGTLIAFIPWFEVLLAFRFALGFVSVSIVFGGFVLSVELVGGNWRTVAGICYLFPVSLSYIMITGIAYLIRDWRYLQLTISLPVLIFQIFWWTLPESPRWLLAVGRTDELMVILQNAAKFNKTELPTNLDKQLLPVENETPNESGQVMDLFKTRKLRKITFLLFVIWFVVYLSYYGVMLNIGNINGDLYINTILMAVVEIPAIALSLPILLKGGRRWPLALTMIVSGLSCGIAIPMYFLPDNSQWLITVFTMISKFSSSSSNAIVPVFTAELYPTTIRNIGCGASNVPAGIALMLVPYLWTISTVHKIIPMSILAGCGIIGGICVLFLPETGSGKLLSTVEAIEGRNSCSSETRQVNNNG